MTWGPASLPYTAIAFQEYGAKTDVVGAVASSAGEGEIDAYVDPFIQAQGAAQSDGLETDQGTVASGRQQLIGDWARKRSWQGRGQRMVSKRRRV